MGEDNQLVDGDKTPLPGMIRISYGGMVLGYIGATVGFLHGLILSYLALGLMGAGHGTGIGLLAVPCVVAIPVLGIAWGFYQSRLADLFMAPVLMYAILVDSLFILWFDRPMYQRAPDRFQMFYLLWSVWQIPLVALLCVRISIHIASWWRGAGHNEN